ncbi:hypothetical protein AAG906_021638 [Vitis piasezkii]
MDMVKDVAMDMAKAIKEEEARYAKEKRLCWIQSYAKGRVWQVKLLDDGIWFQASNGRSHSCLNPSMDFSSHNRSIHYISWLKLVTPFLNPWTISL